MAYMVGKRSVATSIDVPNPFAKGRSRLVWAAAYERGRAQEFTNMEDNRRRRQAREAFYRANPQLRGKTFLETLRFY
jgi:hypothetical protein